MKSIYAFLPEAQVNVLKTTLSERARTRYPEFWGQCKASSATMGGINPNVEVTYEKDGTVSGKVTFYLLPKHEGDHVRTRESYFRCSNPTDHDPAWSMVNDWAD
jgi:hypothetical protein